WSSTGGYLVMVTTDFYNVDKVVITANGNAFLLDDTNVSTVVSSGQTHDVSSGQTETGDIVLSGGTLDVLSGGTISSTHDSGTINVLAGGSAFDTAIYYGGSETVSAGGIDQSARISGGTQYVYGLATGDINYGFQFVESGGIASGTVISGGEQVIY